MKSSPNREQLLFLATGGIILVLILVVVIFNMVRGPGDMTAEEETVTAPQVKVGDRAPENQKGSWLTRVAPAPIFNSEPKPPAEADANTKADPNAKAAGGKPAPKTDDKWNTKEASSMEAARLESKPAPKENTLSQSKPPSPLPKNPPAPTRETRADAPPAKPGDADDFLEVEPPAKPAVAKGTEKTHEKPVEKSVARNEPPPKPIEPPSRTKKPAEEDSGEQETAKTAAKTPPATENKEAKESSPAATIASHKGRYVVQMGSYTDNSHATEMAVKLSQLLLDGRRMPVHKMYRTVNKKTVYRITLGPFGSLSLAQRAANLAQTKAAVKGTVVSARE
ncbi:MAG: SPOR domain-containing protein [Magnetococcales bacterium]|nr:SPOR domain-containing protein [Magnetococcales bacterium]